MDSFTQLSAADVTDAAWPLSEPWLPAEHLWPLTNNALLNQTSTSPPSRTWRTPSSPGARHSSGGPTSSGPPHASVGGPSASLYVEGQGEIDIKSRRRAVRPHV